MTIVREEALLRNGVRYGDPAVRKAGTRIYLTHVVVLFDDKGERSGTAFVEISGRRIFGRLVDFGEDAVTLRCENLRSESMLLAPGEAEDLRATARYIVEELAKLCRCGKLPTHCDCCPKCLGSGYSRLTPSLIDCLPCHGKGYREADSTPSEPSKGGPGGPLNAP